MSHDFNKPVTEISGANINNYSGNRIMTRIMTAKETKSRSFRQASVKVWIQKMLKVHMLKETFPLLNKKESC